MGILKSEVIKNMTEGRRKEYMKSVYSKGWTLTRKQAGIHQYDKDLIHELTKEYKNGKVLEVAIGDGLPYAQQLNEVGYEVFGIDIAPTHIDLVKKLFPSINVTLGDAEDLCFSSDFFEIVYCFRSTWYFPNLTKAISEMLRVVKVGGLIMFDIQNMNHPIHQKSIKMSLRKERNHLIMNLSEKFIKNFIKILLRRVNFHSCDWSFQKFITIETPTDPSSINIYLQNQQNIEYNLYGVKWDHTSRFVDNYRGLEEINESTNLDQFDRLVFKVMKIN